MARQFNGTSDELHAASAINFSAYSLLSCSFWFQWDSYVSDGKLLWRLSPTFNPGGFWVVPNHSNNGFAILVYASASNADRAEVTRASVATGAWHHMCVSAVSNSNSGAPAVTFWELDGGASSYSTPDSSGASGTVFQNDVIHCMWNGGAAYSAGKLCELAIWGGLTLTHTDSTQLWNGGNGTDARNLSAALSSLVYYNKISGTASPEPATIGTVALTVVNTTFVASPSGVNDFGGAADPLTWLRHRR